MKAVSFAFLGVLALALSSCGSGIGARTTASPESPPAETADLVPAAQAQALAVQREKGLSAQYFRSENFSGGSIKQTDSFPLFIRGQSNVTRKLSGNALSIVWDGFIQPKYSENYTFRLGTDGNASLQIGSTKVITIGKKTGDFSFESNKWYKIHIEYSSINKKNQYVGLAWSSKSQKAQIIPQFALRPVVSSVGSQTIFNTQAVPEDEGLLFNESFDIEPLNLYGNGLTDGWGFTSYNQWDNYYEPSQNHERLQPGHVPGLFAKITNRISGSSNSTQDKYVDYQELPVEYAVPGTVYTLSGWGKNTGNTQCQIGFFANSYTGYNNNIEYATLNTPKLTFSGSDWQYQTIKITLPSQVPYSSDEQQQYGFPASDVLTGLAVGLIGVDGGTGSCSFDDLDLRVLPPNPTASSIIGSAGGILTLGDAKVEVPAGAVAIPTTFTLEQQFAPPSPIPVGPYQFLSSFKFTTNGSDFKKSLKLTIPAITPSSADDITELYSWDGQEYTKERIGGIGNNFELDLEPMDLNLPPASTGGLNTISASGITIKSQSNSIYSKDYSVLRIKRPSLAALAAATGGEFNGVYIQCPEGKISYGFQGCVFANPQAVVQPLAAAKVFLSMNVGNASPYCSTFFGSNHDYVAKLCSYATEERVRNRINRIRPDLVTIQEFWNDDCFANPSDPANDRVCSASKSKIGTAYILQHNRILNPQIYDVRCASRINGHHIGGYECTGVRRATFAFDALSLAVSTNFPQAKAAIPNYCSDDDPSHGEDTGFFGQSILLLNPVGIDNSSFDLWNGHLASPAPINPLLFDFTPQGQLCRRDQISSLHEAYRTTRRKVLIAGDFNTEYDGTYPGDGELRTLSTRFNTPVSTEPLATYGRLAYMVSDQNEYTGFSFPTQDRKYDHVLSNFTDTPSGNKCIRIENHGLDHRATQCYLYGFDSGQTKAAYQGLDGSLVNSTAILSSLGTVYRRGVAMPFSRVSGLYIHDVTIRSNLPSIVKLSLNCPLYSEDVSKLIVVSAGGYALGSDNSQIYNGRYYSDYCPQ
jgi:hypothetical protein